MADDNLNKIVREDTKSSREFSVEELEYLRRHYKDFDEILKKRIVTAEQFLDIEKTLLNRYEEWEKSLEGLVGRINNMLEDLKTGSVSSKLANSSIKKFTGTLESLTASAASGDLLGEKEIAKLRGNLTLAAIEAEQSVKQIRRSYNDTIKGGFGNLEGLEGKELVEELINRGLDEKIAESYAKGMSVQQNANQAEGHLEDQIKHSREAKINSGTSLTKIAGGALSKLGLGDMGEALKEYATNAQKAYKRTLDAGGTKAEAKAAATREKRAGYGNLIASLKGAASAALWAKILSNFLSVNKAAVDARRSIGGWNVQLASAHGGFATTKETLETIASLAKQTSLNVAQIFTGEELGRIANAQKLFGMTAEQANALGVFGKLNNQNAEEYSESLFKGLQAGVQSTGKSIAMGEALKAAASASDAIKVSMGGSAERLGKAQAAASALGMTLQDVENISRNLINFESSIENQMKAQLMTGMSLNLAKARELALNNDLEGVAKEIANQGITMQKYGSMNILQQESLAAALGMSREQMSKMLITQALANGQSADAVAKTMKMNVEQVKGLSTQQKLSDVMTRLADIFAPFLQAVVGILEPILNFVGWIFGLVNRLPGVFKTILVLLIAARWASVQWGIGFTSHVIPAVSKVALLLKNSIFSGSWWQNAWQGAKKFVGALADSGTWKKIGGFFTSLTRKETWQGLGKRIETGNWGKAGKLGDKVMSSGGSRVAENIGGSGVADKAAQSGSTIAKGSEQATKGANGFGKINMGNILKGAAAMLIMAAALWVLAKACQELSKVGWKEIAMAGVLMIGLAISMRIASQILQGAGPAMMTAAVYILAFGGAVALVAMGIGVAIWLIAQGIATIVDSITGLVTALGAAKGIGKDMIGLAAGIYVLGPALLLFGICMLLGGWVAIPILIALAKSFTALSGANFNGIASGIRLVAKSVKELSNSLDGISALKLIALAALAKAGGFSNLGNESAEGGEEVTAEEGTTEISEVKAKPENRETIEENASAAKKNKTTEETVKTEARASSDLSRIESKLDIINQSIINSRPDWDWLRFSEGLQNNTNVAFK